MIFVFEKTVVIKLQKPIEWEDKTFNDVSLDFSKVTGKVIIDAERQMFQGANMAIVRPMSADYCSRIASAISGIPYRALEKLHASDFDAVWQTVGAFVGNKDPQEFYDQYAGNEAFTNPGEAVD